MCKQKAIVSRHTILSRAYLQGSKTVWPGTKNLPECSKQNIFQRYSVFSKKKVFTKIIPFFSHRISVIFKKGLHLQVCPNNFKFVRICFRSARITFKRGGGGGEHVLPFLPTPMVSRSTISIYCRAILT